MSCRYRIGYYNRLIAFCVNGALCVVLVIKSKQGGEELMSYSPFCSTTTYKLARDPTINSCPCFYVLYANLVVPLK